jgi:hypothetical protein
MNTDFRKALEKGKIPASTVREEGRLHVVHPL